MASRIVVRCGRVVRRQTPANNFHQRYVRADSRDGLASCLDGDHRIEDGLAGSRANQKTRSQTPHERIADTGKENEMAESPPAQLLNCSRYVRAGREETGCKLMCKRKKKQRQATERDARRGARLALECGSGME